MPEENLGDINSSEPGTGVRFNAGKPPLHLIPLGLISSWMTLQRCRVANTGPQYSTALSLLGEFQTRKGERPDQLTLLLAMDELGPDWEECAYVFQYGITKYKEWNWAKGMSWQVVVSCAARHILAAYRGQEPDKDSKRSHVGHAMCNLVMLWQYVDTWPEGDDRPPAALFCRKDLSPEVVMVPDVAAAHEAPYGYNGKIPTKREILAAYDRNRKSAQEDPSDYIARMPWDGGGNTA